MDKKPVKIIIKGASSLTADQKAKILQKAAEELNVVLVEQEPSFETKAYLPHTIQPIADLEEWLYSIYANKLNTLKNELVKRLGFNVNATYVQNQTELKEIHKSSMRPLQVLTQYKTMITNPDVTKQTKKYFYDRAKFYVNSLDDKNKVAALNMLLEIRDLL